MPKVGYTTFTVKTVDSDRLLAAAKEILQDSPVKAEDMSPAEQLRLLLDEHDKLNIEPEKEG